MPNTVNVTSRNPASWIVNFEKEVLDGYYADDSVHGTPKFDVIFDITLAQGEVPEERNDLSKVNQVVIEGFNDTTWVLDVQDAIIQGFRVKPDTLQLAGHFSPHIVVLERAVEAVERATTADPKVEEQNASEELTEAPKPINKGGRPRKVIKENK